MPSSFHLRGTGLEDHSLLNEDQIVTQKRTRPKRRRCLLGAVAPCKYWVLAGTVAALWLTFFGVWVYWTYLSPDVEAGLPAAPSVARLVVLPRTLADETGAVCLDGSPPSFYHRKASSVANGTSWVVFLSSGDWCYNDTDCAARSATASGSSRGLNESRELHGILSADRSVNPDFYDWNVAVINQCDGAAFSGNLDLPVVTARNRTVYYRGARVLEAVFNYLLQSAGMGQADRILLGGSSAGGLAVLLHADLLRSLAPTVASFKAVADAGFLIDEPDVRGERSWRDAMKNVFELQQVRGSLDEDCLLARNQRDQWECFLAENAYPYLTTPTFIVNAAYDYWVQRNVLRLRCQPTRCPSADSALFERHRQVASERLDQVNRYDQDGMFVTSCYAHAQTIDDEAWSAYRIAGVSTREAVGDWYHGRTPSQLSRFVDCATGFGCNPTCADTWSDTFYQRTVLRCWNDTQTDGERLS